MRAGKVVIPHLVIGGAMKIYRLRRIRNGGEQTVRTIDLGTSKNLISLERPASIGSRLPEEGIIDHTLEIGCKDLGTPGQRERRNGQEEE